MKRRIFLAGALALVVARHSDAWAKPSKYRLLGTSFECPLALSKPLKVGLEASSMGFPAQAQKAEFTILVCEFDKQGFALLKEAGMDPSEYAKTTYLGITKPATQKSTRKFAQGAQTGEVYPESFPNKDYLETFWLERKGAGVMLAFRVSKSMPMQGANEAIDKICQTFEWKQ